VSSNNINQKVGKATAWSSITEIMAKLISPIVNMVLARLLVPEAFGVVATITMVISFAEVFTDAGFQKYLIQHDFKDEDELNKSTNVAFWTNLSVSTLACIIIFIFRHQIANLVGNPELGNSISLASILIIIAAFSSIQMARFKRDLDFKSLFVCRIISAFIPFFITIPLAFILKSYWALVIGTLSINLFNAVYLSVKSKWKFKAFYSFKLLKEMFSFAVWTLIETLVIWLTSNVDIFNE
jgi:PST family polysaccharide transporter